MRQEKAYTVLGHLHVDFFLKSQSQRNREENSGCQGFGRRLGDVGQRYKLPAMRRVSSGDVTCSMVTAANNTVL